MNAPGDRASVATKALSDGIPSVQEDRSVVRQSRIRTIEIASALGFGPTKLAAFDNALIATGIANHNLLRLSSVIPPATDIVVREGPVATHMGEWGDRLYVVMAEQRSDQPGDEVWAGIGWVQEEVSGRGLFVEHEGDDEAQLRSDLESTMQALVRGRPNHAFGPINTAVQGGVCRAEPVCSLVVAVYEAESWRSHVTIDLTGQG
jgi:arginine decarboxylase